ncbi:thyrotroph embryonic factor-like isoform X2 [Dreissena polymorpha]|uniref:thyrotroph embryonic factor-like isoform X2 n=1 Tax=Dreissena polymorpha TaxID=45954 RepID=UPI002264C22F|nr:thyrotroph embryonic factor-like isoform X2 [Dreissena polymorpha]
MSNFRYTGHGFSLKALLEDPDLQNPTNLQTVGPSSKKAGKNTGNVHSYNSAFLASGLWDKSRNHGSDAFDLEYMDLDEFLSENGIPVSLEDHDDSEAINLLASALGSSPPSSPKQSPASPHSPPHGLNTSSKSQRMNLMTSMSPKRELSPLYMPMSPDGMRIVSPNSLSPVMSPARQEQPTSAIERCLLDDNFGIKNTLPWKPQVTVVKKTATPAKPQYKPEELSMTTIPVYMQRSPVPNYSASISPRSTKTWSQSSKRSYSDDDDDDDSDSDNDDEIVTQNNVPGQENFDPTSHKFTDEDLKPQPIIKKSRKVFVDDSAKDDKYWQRRKKNNVAAKRSRDARRVKENQIAMRAAFLEKQNDTLREKYEEIMKENQALIERLSKYENV